MHKNPAFMPVINLKSHVVPVCGCIQCRLFTRTSVHVVRPGGATILHVVVVFDPHRYHASFESTLNTTDWVEMELESTWVKMALECEGRKDFIF